MSPSPAVLAHWSNFYAMVGSAAAALTGLQFVVITLIAEARVAGSMREIRAFGSPTVVHFCAALLISAVMVAPWQALWHIAICLGVFAVAGIVYSCTVIRHARQQTGYQPEPSDWLWFLALPPAAYAALAASGLLLVRNTGWSCFAIAGCALLFLFIGIHNAWDTVTYVVITRKNDAKEKD